jgi:hypothetical protein
VRFRVQNTGTRGRTFGGGQQYLFDRDGNRHDPDLAATLGSGGDWSTQLNPGQRLAGTLVYDLPEAAVPVRVELHDAPFSGGASVALAEGSAYQYPRAWASRTAAATPSRHGSPWPGSRTWAFSSASWSREARAWSLSSLTPLMSRRGPRRRR